MRREKPWFLDKFVVYLHRPPFFTKTQKHCQHDIIGGTTARPTHNTFTKNGGTFQELKCHSITNKPSENAECSTIHVDVCTSPAKRQREREIEGESEREREIDR